jgi:hypothetical protein
MPTYKNTKYEIERREVNGSAKYNYEFYLVVDGEDVITATELERRGYSGPEDGGSPWSNHLKRYAKAYIDGSVEN